MGADYRHMRGWVGRILSVTLAALALASLAACGGGPGSPSSGGFLSGATSWFGGSTKIAIAPIIGTTPEIAAQMTDALVVAGKDRKLTLLPAGGKANYTLRGYLVASSERQGAKISYIWDLTDAQGSRVARVSGDEIIAKRAGSDPWSAVDAAAIRSIAGKTTSQLAASLPRGRSSAPVVAASPSSSSTERKFQSDRLNHGHRHSRKRFARASPEIGRRAGSAGDRGPGRRAEVADGCAQETPLCRRREARQRHFRQRLHG